MTDAEASLATEPPLVRRLSADHANLTSLLLVIESLLVRLHGGEALDRSLIADVVEYSASYLERVHEPRERRALEAVAAVVPMVAALRRVLGSHESDVVAALARWRQEDLQRRSADDLVRAGFAYTRALRTRIGFEESVVLSLCSLASAAAERADGQLGADEAARAADEVDDRASFEALTARLGCDCPFE